MNIEKRNAWIRAYAKTLPKRVHHENEWVSMNYHVWMPLARQWKMSIIEIKKIVKGDNHGRTS